MHVWRRLLRRFAPRNDAGPFAIRRHGKHAGSGPVPASEHSTGGGAAWCCAAGSTTKVLPFEHSTTHWRSLRCMSARPVHSLPTSAPIRLASAAAAPRAGRNFGPWPCVAAGRTGAAFASLGLAAGLRGGDSGAAQPAATRLHTAAAAKMLVTVRRAPVHIGIDPFVPGVAAAVVAGHSDKFW